MLYPTELRAHAGSPPNRLRSAAWAAGGKDVLLGLPALRRAVGNARRGGTHAESAASPSVSSVCVRKVGYGTRPEESNLRGASNPVLRPVLVEPRRIELLTYALRTRRSPS